MEEGGGTDLTVQSTHGRCKRKYAAATSWTALSD